MLSTSYIRSLAAGCFFLPFLIHAQRHVDFTVSKDGSGDFKTIGKAIEALPPKAVQRYVIFIKDGIYEEKLRIEQDYVTLLGESKEGTQIRYEQPKKDWMANKDYEGPAVVNIYSDDVVLENLTIQNTMPETGPTAYVVRSTGTRTILKACRILNNGANSVTLMDYKTGMYYLKDCYIEGTVDFTKATGWCYIENCHFFQKEAIASVWHAGITDPGQKMVIRNSKFDGVEHFFLGRHHEDAQFFLIGCRFTERMADMPLYRKDYPEKPAKERPDIYGDRYYYYNCRKEGKDYDWYADNLQRFSDTLRADLITADWTFGGRWDPESTAGPVLVRAYSKDNLVFLQFDQPLTVRGELLLETQKGNRLRFHKGKGRNTLSFVPGSALTEKELIGPFRIISGQVVKSEAVSEEVKLSGTFGAGK